MVLDGDQRMLIGPWQMLTDWQYAQTEKECLGLVFECEIFHSDVYGLDIHLGIEKCKRRDR